MYTRMSYPPMRIIGRFFIAVKFIIPVILNTLNVTTRTVQVWLAVKLLTQTGHHHMFVLKCR